MIVARNEKLSKILVYFVVLFSLNFARSQTSKHPQAPLAQKNAVLLLQELKKNLQEQMTRGGPLKALEFCHLQAIPLTQEVQNKIPKDWTLKRISHKSRNPQNAPDTLDTQALKELESKNLQEYWIEEKAQDGALLSSRYYKAIKIDSNCLVCHGMNIQESLKTKLQELYPEDKATGYKIGDFRGALRVVIPN